MAFDLHTAALIVGALALLVALLGGALLRTGAVRGIVAIAGVAVLAWGALPYLAHPQPPVPTSELGPTAAQPTAAQPAASPPPLPGAPGRAAAAAIEDCNAPNPPAVPDAAKASRAEMVAAHTAFQAYDAATKTYTGCVDAAVDRISQQFAQAGADELNTVKVLGLGAHNQAIDQEQALADQFNAQVRAFKAKHPGP
jgi:hypothetical protein